MEVLVLISKGFSTQEIAKKLGNSDRTIESIRYRMQLKTGTKNAAHLVAYGYENGILKISQTGA